MPAMRPLLAATRRCVQHQRPCVVARRIVHQSVACTHLHTSAATTSPSGGSSSTATTAKPSNSNDWLSYNTAALKHLHSHHYYDAAQLFLRCISDDVTTGGSVERYISMANLGSTYVRMQQWTAALPMLQTATTYLKQLHNEQRSSATDVPAALRVDGRVLASSYRNLAIVYTKLPGKQQDAVNAYERACESYAAERDNVEAAATTADAAVDELKASFARDEVNCNYALALLLHSSFAQPSMMKGLTQETVLERIRSTLQAYDTAIDLGRSVYGSESEEVKTMATNYENFLQSLDQ